METMFAYRRTSALVTAIQLDLFSAIGELKGPATVAEIARKIGASEKGTRVLCDYLTIQGFLTKDASGYSLTGDSAMFLDRRSPACMAGAARFLAPPEVKQMAHSLSEAVRKGGTVLPEGGGLAAEAEEWIDFARGMAPLMVPAAETIARVLGAEKQEPWKVLDIAASHGLFGITLARHNPKAEIVALDWKNVLEVTKENAVKAGLDGRFHTLPGSAFEVEFGGGYDVILLTNILHHFDAATNEKLLRKCRTALKPGGRSVILEFLPNDDRVSPPFPAAFSMVMLESTPAGDAYTEREFASMAANAGYQRVSRHAIGPHPESILVLEN